MEIMKRKYYELTSAEQLRLEQNTARILAAGTKNNPSVIPQIGMGVTTGCGSDCYPHTIVQVSRTLDWIEITADTATPVKDFDYYANQTYQYSSNPDGERSRAKLHTRGKLSGRYGSHIYIGHRRYYQDPSF